MRNNQPVIDRECVIPADIAIVSRTDAKGVITFVNDDFLAHAGYDKADLIGKPHNIVRHPDMPAEAFRDMWAMLQAGRAWTGLVKNRRKDGGYYWVKATATPTPDGGYMSVRVRPERAEIEAAEALYRAMRENPRMRLEGGRVKPVGLAAGMRWLLDRKLSTKLWMSTLASMFGILAAVALGWFGIAAAAAGPVPEAYRWGLMGLAGCVTLIWPVVAYWVIGTFSGPLRQAIDSAHAIAPSTCPVPFPWRGATRWASCWSSLPSCATTSRKGLP